MQKKFSLELFTKWFFALGSIAGLVYVRLTYPNSEKGYPSLIFGLMLIFSAFCLYQHYFQKKSEAVEEQTEKPKSRGDVYMYGVIVVSIAYMLLMNVLGFLIDTLLYTILIPVFLGYRKPLPIILTSICCMGFVYFLFTKLYIPIPAGILALF